MTEDLNRIDAKAFLVMSAKHPKEAMRLVLALGLSARAIWLIFAIVMIANTIVDAIMLSHLGKQISSLGFELVVPSPFGMLQSKVLVLLAVALALSRFRFDTKDRGLRFFEVLQALLLYRVMATVTMAIGMVLFFLSPELSSLFLLVTQVYMVWLVANYTSVALGDIPVGNALFLLFIALLIGMSLLLFVMVVFSLLFGIGP
jgi:hypothetical protein